MNKLKRLLEQKTAQLQEGNPCISIFEIDEQVFKYSEFSVKSI